MKNDIDQKILDIVSPLQNSTSYLNEAKFGYNYIRPYLLSLKEGAKVLEIGAGSCVLLSQIKSAFSNLDVSGIEPIGPGFHAFRSTLHSLQNEFDFDLFHGSYEDFPTTTKYDFVYSVNVFEHLDSWVDHLGFLEKILTNNGKCVILCPNYGFPYESHFSLPVVYNKKFTYRIFKSSIQNYERENNVEGLWSSLNFVTLRKVEREIGSSNFKLTSYPITEDMVSRLATDTEFRRRQKALAQIAILMDKFRLLGVFRLPLLRFFAPYMFLELRLDNPNN